MTCIYIRDILYTIPYTLCYRGAMENKSLNVFNSAYVLADGRTDTDYERILGVIGHEYFQLVYTV